MDDFRSAGGSKLLYLCRIFVKNLNEPIGGMSMKTRIVQKIGCVLVGLVAANLAAFAGDVARVYVVRPGTGVSTYIVDNTNNWRSEGTFFSNNDFARPSCRLYL